MVYIIVKKGRSDTRTVHSFESARPSAARLESIEKDRQFCEKLALAGKRRRGSSRRKEGGLHVVGHAPLDACADLLRSGEPITREVLEERGIMLQNADI